MINIICEVYGILGGGNCCVVNEIQFYDSNNSLISYTTTTTDCYDQTTGSVSTYWTSTGTWAKNGLNDGNTAYGASTATVFLYSNGTSNFARFLIQLNTTSISNIKKVVVSVGNNAGRIPNTIHFYYSPNYNINTDLKTRTNTGLTDMQGLTFSSSTTSSTQFTITYLTIKYLIQDGTLLKTISNGNLVTVCNTTDSGTTKETAYLNSGMSNLSSWTNSLMSQVATKPPKVAIYKK